MSTGVLIRVKGGKEWVKFPEVLQSVPRIGEHIVGWDECVPCNAYEFVIEMVTHTAHYLYLTVAIV